MGFLTELKNIKDLLDWGIGKYYSKMDTNMYLRQIYFELKLNKELLDHVDIQKIENKQQASESIKCIIRLFKTEISEGIFYKLKHDVYKKLEKTKDVNYYDETSDSEKSTTIKGDSLINHIRFVVEKISSLKLLLSIEDNTYLTPFYLKVRLINIKNHLDLLTESIFEIPEIKSFVGRNK